MRPQEAVPCASNLIVSTCSGHIHLEHLAELRAKSEDHQEWHELLGVKALPDPSSKEASCRIERLVRVERWPHFNNVRITAHVKNPDSTVLDTGPPRSKFLLENVPFGASDDATAECSMRARLQPGGCRKPGLFVTRLVKSLPSTRLRGSFGMNAEVCGCALAGH